jgi:Ran-binding protein 9/10
MDSDRNSTSIDGGASGPSPRPPQLPFFSRAFERYMHNGSADSNWAGHQRNNSFFTPSYLRGTNYIQKLEEAHLAQQAQKEAQQQAGGGMSTNTSTGSLSAKPSASHLGMKIDIIERAPSFDDDSPVAPLPSRWNKDDKYGGLEVLADGQEVKYSTPRPREHDHEICAIRADHPIPQQAGIYYFEVGIMARRRDEYVPRHKPARSGCIENLLIGIRTTVCVGVSGKSVALSRPPGWEPESFGYHGDDGDIYLQNNVGKHYGQRFGPGDVVGCGINFRTRTAFFTKNGHKYGMFPLITTTCSQTQLTDTR